MRFYERFVKRGCDVVLSLLALMILAPLFLILIILSKLFIHGKVFFTQYRPGKDGKLFKLYKFKSMTEKTDAYGELLPDQERITVFGRFLRWSSLDELPQLVNILRGEMSFVGPRPRLVVDMVFYRAEVFPAYRVRPGLTGLDQISRGRSFLPWDDIFKKDLAYQRKITFWGDLRILIGTVFALFRPEKPTKLTPTTPREYYYADYLLQQNIISREQYLLGQARAKAIIAQMGTVTYCADLQPKGVQQ